MSAVTQARLCFNALWRRPERIGCSDACTRKVVSIDYMITDTPPEHYPHTCGALLRTVH